MPGHRHARPRGRRGVAAAYNEVQREVGTLRAQQRIDAYELVRLGAVVQSLKWEITRISDELVTARREVATAKRRPPSDLLVEMLANQAAAIGDELAATQRTVVELSTRLSSQAQHGPVVEPVAPVREPVTMAPAVPLVAAAGGGGGGSVITGSPTSEEADNLDLATARIRLIRKTLQG